jgi:hypothetical protein
MDPSKEWDRPEEQCDHSKAMQRISYPRDVLTSFELERKLNYQSEIGLLSCAVHVENEHKYQQRCCHPDRSQG